MTDISTQFKQQTFALLRQQAITLKQKQQQLHLKAQQINFLKDTIHTLQLQTNQLTKSNSQLNNKLQIVMGEVKRYDNEVVQKIYRQNQQLMNRWQFYESQLEKKERIIKQACENKEHLEKQNGLLRKRVQKLDQQIKQQNISKQKYTQQLQNSLKKIHKLENTLQATQKQLGKTQAVTEQLSLKLKNSQKQNQYLLKKSQQTIQQTQQKLKTLKMSYIKKQQHEKLLNELHQTKNINVQLSKQSKKYKNQINQLNIQINKQKQKYISFEYKQEMKSALLDADIRVLKESLSIRKRIAQFQSQYSQYFYTILQEMINLKDQLDQLTYKQTNFHHTLQNNLGKISKLQKQLKQKQQQTLQLQDKYNREVQCIQASYEGKIIQLSIKIKQQEKALQEISLKQQQSCDIEQQYDKLVEEHTQMKDTLQNTINQYQKQNQKLLQEIKQLCEICNQNINTTTTINNLKHIIVNLLCCIQYLYMNLVRNREMRRKLYLPFINNHLQIWQQKQSNIVQHNKKGKVIKNRRIRKFRAYVWMMIAISRMKKSINDSKIYGSSGLLRYTNKSLSNRNSIDDYNGFADQILQIAVKSQGQINQLVHKCKNIYKWSDLPNYMKINISMESLQRYGLQ